MQIPAAKVFEKPAAGPHIGILTDVVDLGIITTVYEGKTKSYPAIRFIWTLSTLGSDGKPLQVWSKKINASSWHEKGNLYKTVKMILGTPPLPTLDPETMIGQVRQLFVSRDLSPDGTKDFANIMGIAPAPPGFQMAIPADYVRFKFRPQTTAGPKGQAVQTYQQPPVQQAYQQQPAQPQTQFQQQPQQAPQNQGADIKF